MTDASTPVEYPRFLPDPFASNEVSVRNHNSRSYEYVLCGSENTINILLAKFCEIGFEFSNEPYSTENVKELQHAIANTAIPDETRLLPDNYGRWVDWPKNQ